MNVSVIRTTETRRHGIHGDAFDRIRMEKALKDRRSANVKKLLAALLAVLLLLPVTTVFAEGETLSPAQEAGETSVSTGFESVTSNDSPHSSQLKVATASVTPFQFQRGAGQEWPFSAQG